MGPSATVLGPAYSGRLGRDTEFLRHEGVVAPTECQEEGYASYTDCQEEAQEMDFAGPSVTRSEIPLEFLSQLARHASLE
jgi:hypothetical protein